MRPASYLRHLAQLIPDLPRRPPAVRDPEMKRWAAGTDRYRTFNLHAALSALELIDEVKPLVPTTSIPTLIIQGRLDTVVEPANATWLYQNLGASEKALISLPHSDHLVALDRERDRAIRPCSSSWFRDGDIELAADDRPPGGRRAAGMTTTP